MILNRPQCRNKLEAWLGGIFSEVTTLFIPLSIRLLFKLFNRLEHWTSLHYASWYSSPPQSPHFVFVLAQLALFHYISK